MCSLTTPVRDNSSGTTTRKYPGTGPCIEVGSFDAQTGIVAPPVTNRIDGEQYVAIVASWDGTMALLGGGALKADPSPNRSRLLVFKLDGDEALPPAVDDAENIRSFIIERAHYWRGVMHAQASAAER